MSAFTNCQHPKELRSGTICTNCRERVVLAQINQGFDIWYLRGPNRFHVPTLARLFVTLHEAMKAVESAMNEASRAYHNKMGW